MPDATFLQIHGRGDVPMRTLELRAGLVRIGRGPLCEIRLREPNLSDVQCMLRRRGDTWHFQPVGPPGQVWIDGRPVDQQRPLPMGVPFRVGDHWLTLRPADSAFNDWGSYDAPITIESDGFTPSDPAPEPVEAAGRASTPTTDDDEERLRRWQARLDQRDRWLKDRQDERRWEARWKSAGETIRARSAPAAPSPQRSAPARPAATPTPAPRPPQAPPVARIIEPRRPEPLRRVAEPGPRPATARVPLRPMPESPAPPSRTVGPPRAAVPIRPARVEPPIVKKPGPVDEPRALVTLPSPPVHPPSPVEGAIPAPIEPEIPPVEVGPTPGIEARTATVEPAEGIVPVDEIVGGEPEVVALGPEAPGVVEEHEVQQTVPNKPISIETLDDTAPAVVPPIEFSKWVEELPDSTVLEDWAPEPQSSEVVPRSIDLEPNVAPAPWAEPPVRKPVSNPDVSNAEWPSAQAIFAAQGRRPHPAPEVATSRRRRSVEPEPTDALAPRQWSLPLWLGWFPVLSMVLVLGLGGTALTYEWAVEANNANNAMRLALRADSRSPASVDVSSLPRGGWWRSSSPHLAAWAMALERSGDGEDHDEEIRSLIDSAEGASHFAARTRFVLDPPDSSEPGSTTELSKLGRPRDVITLVWTARRHFKAGKLDAALRAYRSAMVIAAKAGRDDLDAPIFDDEPQVRRYALPRESLLGLAVHDMAEASDWTIEQWIEALPPSSVASLVASRALARKQKRGDADRLADLAIRQAETSPPPGFDPAEHRAAGAEALALRGRWTDASEQYRLAIDQVEDDATRRMWWLNLAEVAHRLGDESGRARAIEAAKTTDTMDKITKRALEFQQLLPGLVSSSARH